MSDDLNPDNEVCARCGEVAAGYAYIMDDRYCHPDDPNAPDCYALSQYTLVDEMRGAFPNWTEGVDAVEYVRRLRIRPDRGNAGEI